MTWVRPPQFGIMKPDVSRHGYERAAAALVAAELGPRLKWVVLPSGDVLLAGGVNGESTLSMSELYTP